MNPESRIAEGTFEINWQLNILKSSVFFFKSHESSDTTGWILAIFPAKMKKNTNVKSRG